MVISVKESFVNIWTLCYKQNKTITTTHRCLQVCKARQRLQQLEQQLPGAEAALASSPHSVAPEAQVCALICQRCLMLASCIQTILLCIFNVR